jgi:hypothetical protein
MNFLNFEENLKKEILEKSIENLNYKNEEEINIQKKKENLNLFKKLQTNVKNTKNVYKINDFILKILNYLKIIFHPISVWGIIIFIILKFKKKKILKDITFFDYKNQTFEKNIYNFDFIPNPLIQYSQLDHDKNIKNFNLPLIKIDDLLNKNSNNSKFIVDDNLDNVDNVWIQSHQSFQIDLFDQYQGLREFDSFNSNKIKNIV